MNFDFTDEYVVDSELVDEIHYNANDQSLAIEFTSDVYFYENVPQSEVAALAAGEQYDGSVGRHYNFIFKHNYKANKKMNWSEVDYNRVNRATADATTDKGLDFDTADEPTKEFSLASQPVGNSDGPSLHVVADLPTTEYSLQPVGGRVAAATNGDQTYVVFFNEGRSYKPKGVNSVDEAVHALREVADMLDVEVNVEQVVVSFV